MIRFPSSVETLIRQAIAQRRRLSVSHHGLERVIEPYQLIEDKDGVTVHARHVRGQRESVPGWCDLNVAELEWATPLDELF